MCMRSQNKNRNIFRLLDIRTSNINLFMDKITLDNKQIKQREKKKSEYNRVKRSDKKRMHFLLISQYLIYGSKT